jgi:hypothetical protein
LITGKGKTLKKYTLKDDFAARKADMILEIGRKMLWGKDLQALCKANIAMTKELLSKYSNYGSQLRVISPIEIGRKKKEKRSGNEVCGEYGVKPFPIWGQRDPKGDWEETNKARQMKKSQGVHVDEHIIFKTKSI